MNYLKKFQITFYALTVFFSSHTLEAHWTALAPLPPDQIRFVTFDNTNNTYYAAASSPKPIIFSKTESTNSWTPVGPQSGAEALTVEVRSFLRQNNTLYVGSINKVLKKADSDTGWSQLGPTSPGVVVSMALHNNDLYVATTGSLSGVFKINLSDTTAGWQRVGPASGAGSLGSSPNALYFNSTTTSLYVGLSSGSVFVANISLASPTWSQIGPNQGSPGGIPSLNLIRSLNFFNNILFVTTSRGVYAAKVTLPLITWVRLGPDSGASSLNSDVIDITISGPRKIYAASSTGAKLFTSSSDISVGTDFSMGGWSDFGTLSTFPTDLVETTSGLYASTYSGVWKTETTTPNWTMLSNNLPQTPALSLLILNSKLLTATPNGVYQYSGSAWEFVGPSSGAGAVNDYATTLNHSNSKLYVGWDGGVSSRPDSASLSESWQEENPSTPAGALYNSTQSLTNNGSTIFAATYNGVYSRTGSDGWVDISPPSSAVPTPPFRKSTRVLYANTRLYAGTQEGVQSKTDAETVLSILGPSSGPGSLVDPINDLAFSGNTIFASTDAGVFSKAESAASWTSLTPPLPQSKVLLRSTDTLYVGTGEDGVYSKKDTDTSWTRVGPNSGEGSYVGPVNSMLLSGSSLYMGSVNQGIYTFDTAESEGGAGTGGSGGSPTLPSESDASSGGCSLMH